MFFRAIGFKVNRDFRWLVDHRPTLSASVSVGIIGMSLSVVGASAAPSVVGNVNAGVLSYNSGLISPSISTQSSISVPVSLIALDASLVSPSVEITKNASTPDITPAMFSEQLLSPTITADFSNNVAVGKVDHSISLLAITAGSDPWGRPALYVQFESFSENSNWSTYPSDLPQVLPLIDDDETTYTSTDTGNSTADGTFEPIASSTTQVELVIDINKTAGGPSATNATLEVHLSTGGSAVFDYSQDYGSGRQLLRFTIPGSYPAGTVFTLNFGRSGGGSPTSKAGLAFYQIWLEY